MVKSLYVLLPATLVSLLLTWWLWDENYGLYRAQREGLLTGATVSKVASICLGKHNKLGIDIERQHFLLPISAKACRSGRYAVGDTIRVIYHSASNTVLPERADMTFRLWISFLPLLLPVLLFFKLRKVVG